MQASDILKMGAKHLEDRAATYDKSGERSMSKTVSMFNTLTSENITVEQGWLFMAILKMVRCQQGEFKMDSYEDASAYMALAGEEAEMKRGARPAHEFEKTITTVMGNHRVISVQSCDTCDNGIGKPRSCDHSVVCGCGLTLWTPITKSGWENK
jgi:hypothetical protein